MLDKIFKKCGICKEHSEPIRYVREFGIYASTGKLYYHRECIKNAVENPEVHTHRQVDYALHVLTITKDSVDREHNRNKVRSTRIESLLPIIEEV